ncbi:MAG: hypothetical protein HETSPECPRED_002674 [Heterodermia speciosa]|uniref:Protein kinase domain-containing protein n=1 Tax=Heterodermia speciosa TaxID=116794 RepID=A0A8H3PGP5_9LECA|nr:MAG: hypothetical protein HETSPECPRED_002674 [Heterodermia speciosa]
MEALRHTLLPRRLTQIYADTKKSYEHVVRTNQIRGSSQSSPTDRKLRIQKDRLIAWGLEWADSGASHAGDIDDSLDRAGISDLVESIMTSINELLDEAERLQSSTTFSLPGSFPDDKSLVKAEIKQSDRDAARLDDIVRDITTSIDTLCDLSRSQQGLRQPPILPEPSHIRAEPEKNRTKMDEDAKPSYPPAQRARASGPDPSPILSNYIDFHLLRIPRDMAAGPSPPSYESAAARPDDRISAFLQDGHSEFPVVLEYASTLDSSSSTDSLKRRGKEMVESLRAPPQTPDHQGIYVGAMELLGWFEDPHQSRYGLVYRTPKNGTDEKSHHPPRSHMSQHQQSANLLCFLQHSGDTETLNIPSLEDRFRLAYNLASSLYHFHAQGTTHRNLNSNNVMFFFSGPPRGYAKEPEPWKEGAIRKPFLASFDQSDEDALDGQEEPFISSIYRHPRTNRGERSAYKPAYDLYSLGIILIEIGLWMPISRLWKTRYSRSDFKVRLQRVYIRKLAAKCGTTYMRVVENCLRAADESSRDRTRPARPRTDIYWDAVKPLEKCCMIDDEDDASHDPDDGLTEARKLSHRQSSTDEQHQPFAPIPSPEITASNQNEPLDRPAEPEPVVMDSTESLGNHGEEADVLPHEKPDIKASKTPCKCKVWSHELPMACSAYWNSTMCPKLDRMLQKVIDRWESYSIDLFMSGETPEAARPTIYMMCASTDKARKALQYLNRDKNLFDIKVVKGQITRSKAGKRRRPAKKGKQPASQGYQKGLSYRRYQQRPVCGASIGAYLDSHHLPPVSFGGTVLVDGEPYGMSVHHMLENEEVDMGLDHIVDINRSMAPRTEAAEGDDNSSIHSIGPEGLPEALYPFEIEDDEDEGYQSEGDPDTWLSELLESEDFVHHESNDEEVDMGDTDGIEPGGGEALIVTQPAIDDVEAGFFPNEQDMDDDHLSSHSLGHIHASSGIKRSRRGAISHEVDWALIKMTSHRMQTRNVIAGGGQHCTAKPAVPSAHAGNNPSYPSEVVKSEELGGLEVHAIGRTSGLQAGRILPAMSMIKLPGRISSSQSWTVMGNFGAGGDSGAWVVDNATNRVCAHVLAFSERNNTAYISPMEILLEDMAHKLQAPVTLPVDPCAQTSASASKAQHPTSTITPRRPVSRPSSAVVQSSYSSPDTPPPSPPVATSPSPHLVREMSSLSLLGEGKAEDLEAREKPRKGCDDLKCIERIETWGRGFTGSSVRATNLKRRSGGIPAGG